MTLAHDPGIILMPMLSPLPPKFWWKVEVWLTYDSVYLCLMKKLPMGGSVEKASGCAAVDFSITDMDDIVHGISQESYAMVNKHFTRANSPEVLRKAQELQDRLGQGPTPVKTVVKGKGL